MVDFDYTGALKTSWTHFKENWYRLLVPGVISWVVFAFFGLLIILSIVLVGIGIGINIDSIESTWPAYVSIIGIFFTIFIVISVLISAYFRAMYVGMYDEIMKTGKATIGKIFEYGSSFYKSNLQLMLIAFGLTSIHFMLIVLLAVYPIYSFIQSDFSMSAIGLFAFAILLLFIYMLFSFCLGIILFFRLPAIGVSQGQVSGWAIVKDLYHFTIKNIGFVLLTWLISFGIGLVAGMIIFIVMLPLIILGLIPYIGFVFTMVRVVIQTIVTLLLGFYITLFTFNCYYKFTKVNYKVKKKISTRSN